MSALTNWFEGRSVDEHYQRCDWTRIVLEIGCAVIAGILLAGLPGCATTEEGPRASVCTFQLVGQTSSGLPVVITTCVTPEQFAESQK